MGYSLQTKNFDRVAHCGRFSGAFPTGRRTRQVWFPPRIIYPRPYAERSADTGLFKLGLHTEWDKWSAGVVWSPRIGVQGGKWPYRVRITNEAVDGVAGSTGITYAQYPEDDTATTPYLRLYHSGFTAPSGGTKLITFTIAIDDADGVLRTFVNISLTIYAQDHASYLSNFVWFDPSVAAGSNGTGTYASPVSVLSGADQNGNKTLVGTDWNSGSSGWSKTVIGLFKGTGTVKMSSAMSNPPDGTSTRSWFIGYRGPRQVFNVGGGTVTYEIESAVSTSIQPYFSKDVTMRGFKIVCASGTTTNNGIYYADDTQLQNRLTITDLAFENMTLSGDTGNPACIKSGPRGGYVFVDNITGSNIKNANVGNVNGSGLLCVFDMACSLFDRMRMLDGQAVTNDRNAYSMRFKHGSYETEVRRCKDVSVDRNFTSRMWGYTTGQGNHIRAIFRGNTFIDPAGTGTAFITMVNGADTDFDCHSVCVHFNTLRGAMDDSTLYNAAIENSSQLDAYGNMIENASHATNYGWGSMDADWRAPSWASGVITDSLSGAVGSLFGDDGTPINTAHVGQYGHTVFD